MINCQDYCVADPDNLETPAMLLFQDLMAHNVRSVCPGYVDTDMIRISAKKKPDPEACWQKMIDYAPLKRIASTEEIAHAVMYLASEQARFITGTSLAIDGGSTSGK